MFPSSVLWILIPIFHTNTAIFYLNSQTPCGTPSPAACSQAWNSIPPHVWHSLNYVSKRRNIFALLLHPYKPHAPSTWQIFTWLPLSWLDVDHNFHFWMLSNMLVTMLTHIPLDKMANTFEDDIFKRTFLNENVRISIQISLKFVPWGLNDNKSALVQVMAWRRTSDKPLPKLMLTQFTDTYTVYPKKYAHGFVVLCFVVVMQSFIMNSHEVFIHIHQGCFAGTGAIVRLPQCQWSKPDGYGKISQCITTTKHSKAKTVCIFLGIYCMQH